VGEVDTADSELPQKPPDSAAWQVEADRWHIQTMIVPVGRISGFEYFPKLAEFCASETWRPVYLDEVSAVFLRRSPETEGTIDRLKIDCKTAPFSPPAANLSRADRFNFWTNAGFVLAMLGRPQEALDDLDKAQEDFPHSAHLHLQRGDALMRMGKTNEAERELRESIANDPNEGTWEILSSLLWAEQRQDESLTALRNAADVSLAPVELYLELGQREAALQRGKEALADFDEAEKFGVAVDRSTKPGAEFHAELAESRARVWFAMGDALHAIESEEQALQLTPGDKRRWRDLAALYEAMGRNSDAQLALQRAQAATNPQ
jgi:tetratricopeptide (TPR) repeat protein